MKLFNDTRILLGALSTAYFIIFCFALWSNGVAINWLLNHAETMRTIASYLTSPFMFVPLSAVLSGLIAWVQYLKFKKE